MSTLFTLSQSWFNRSALYEQLAFASPGDAVLLLQDAVLALNSPIALASFSAKCHLNDIAVFALSDDCQCRGIDFQQPQYSSIQMVSYPEFVELVVRFDKQLAW